MGYKSRKKFGMRDNTEGFSRDNPQDVVYSVNHYQIQLNKLKELGLDKSSEVKTRQMTSEERIKYGM